MRQVYHPNKLDVWSVACVLLEMVMGRMWFNTQWLETYRINRDVQPADLADVQPFHMFLVHLGQQALYAAGNVRTAPVRTMLQMGLEVVPSQRVSAHELLAASTEGPTVAAADGNGNGMATVQVQMEGGAAGGAAEVDGTAQLNGAASDPTLAGGIQTEPRAMASVEFPPTHSSLLPAMETHPTSALPMPTSHAGHGQAGNGRAVGTEVRRPERRERNASSLQDEF